MKIKLKEQLERLGSGRVWPMSWILIWEPSTKVTEGNDFVKDNWEKKKGLATSCMIKGIRFKYPSAKSGGLGYKGYEMTRLGHDSNRQDMFVGLLKIRGNLYTQEAKIVTFGGGAEGLLLVVLINLSHEISKAEHWWKSRQNEQK